MIKYIGKINRKEVNELYASSRAGIVIYQPAANHYESQPIKIFEFMAAGLPVIASNFPLWKSIIEENGCGICVNPTDKKDVRKACETMINDPILAQRMGKKGRQAVLEKYSWKTEEKTLISLYEEFELEG